jgi:hypothetical protein
MSNVKPQMSKLFLGGGDDGTEDADQFVGFLNEELNRVIIADSGRDEAQPIAGLASFFACDALLWMKSRWLSAPCVSSTLAPIDVPERSNWRPISMASSVRGSLLTSPVICTAN